MEGKQLNPEWKSQRKGGNANKGELQEGVIRYKTHIIKGIRERM